MAIFAIEDDPQAGWDHVSGYRTTAYCVSPYAKRGAVVSTQYNTTSVLRTIEQILGLPPMNQFDASATPMFDCFQETPDLTPFTHVANNVPLDQMNPDPKSCSTPNCEPMRSCPPNELSRSRPRPRRRAQSHSLAGNERDRGTLPRMGDHWGGGRGRRGRNG